MILGLGLDLAASEPWALALQDPSGAALACTFTPGELAAAREGPVPPAERLAARWAAKEAFLKALGVQGIDERPIDPRDIEVVSNPGGRPALVLHRDALSAAEARGARRAWLSLSHEGAQAAAVVVLEG